MIPALVLTAGLATRLRPLSLVRAARLLPTSKAIVAMHPVMVALGAALAAFGLEQKPYEASKIVS